MATTIETERTAAASLTGALDGMRGALDSLGTNVFIADRDLRLVYKNRCAAEVMKSISATVEKLFRVRFEDLIGTHIDSFHGDRMREIRRTLDDPRNLPIRREIKVAHLTLDLNVNAIRDAQGEYVGLVVEAMQKVLETQFRTKFSELHDLRQALLGFAAEYEGRTRVLSARVTEKRATLNESFEAMKKGVAASCHLQNGILDVTGGLSADVNSMVVSLQSNDMVMQRVAHIHRGVEVLQRIYARMEDSSLGESRRSVATLAAIARLEAAQVRAARGQVSEAAQALRDHVGVVMQAVHDFDEDCLLGEYGQAMGGVGGTIQILLECIEDTVVLVNEAAEAARACSRPLEPLGALVASLSEDIAQTGENMHRLALNVQLAAAQHGAGTGLEVLAERMAHIAGEVSRICQTVDTAISKLTGGLRHTLEGFAATVTESGQMRDLFSGNKSESLHEFRDATLTAFGEVGEIVAETHRTAAGMKAVDLNRMCDEILPEMEAALEEIANGAAELAATLGAEDLPADELLALRKQYTMQAERAVHAASVGGAAGASDAELVMAGGDAELGDNVELF
jgi:hypothetical protein